VRIENFIFDDSDYQIVSEKEVTEVREVFKTFELEIK
jgi:hypothetical protein